MPPSSSLHHLPHLPVIYILPSFLQ